MSSGTQYPGMFVDTDDQGRKRIRFQYATWNMHNHLRDPDEDERFLVCLIYTLVQYERSNAMCNFKEAIRTAARALAYYRKIKEAAAQLGFPRFEPMLAPMLTQDTSPDDIFALAELPFVMGMKIMPGNATSTNTNRGIIDYAGARFLDNLEAVRQVNRNRRFPTLYHAEVPDPSVPKGQREARFLRILRDLMDLKPEIPVTIEHISAKETVAFIDALKGLVLGTITPHHATVTGAMADTNIHVQCAPYPGTEEDLKAVLAALLSGYPWYAWGSDNAPHKLRSKQNGAFGAFTAPSELCTLVETLEQNGRLEVLPGLVCLNGPRWYGLQPLEGGNIHLTQMPNRIPDEIPAGDDVLVPYRHGETLTWRLTRDARGRDC